MRSSRPKLVSLVSSLCLMLATGSCETGQVEGAPEAPDAFGPDTRDGFEAASPPSTVAGAATAAPSVGFIAPAPGTSWWWTPQAAPQNRPSSP